jgi:hypothetical protein
MISYKLAIKAMKMLFSLFFNDDKFKDILNVRFNVWKLVWLAFVAMSFIFNVFITVKTIKLLEIKHQLEQVIAKHVEDDRDECIDKILPPLLNRRNVN